jgi:hypothetical protein
MLSTWKTVFIPNAASVCKVTMRRRTHRRCHTYDLTQVLLSPQGGASQPCMIVDADYAKNLNSLCIRAGRRPGAVAGVLGGRGAACAGRATDSAMAGRRVRLQRRTHHLRWPHRRVRQWRVRGASSGFPLHKTNQPTSEPRVASLVMRYTCCSYFAVHFLGMHRWQLPSPQPKWTLCALGGGADASGRAKRHLPTGLPHPVHDVPQQWSRPVRRQGALLLRHRHV